MADPMRRVRDIATGRLSDQGAAPRQFAAFDGEIRGHVRLDGAGLAEVDEGGGTSSLDRKTPRALTECLAGGR